MDGLNSETPWSVHYVDGPSRQFVARGQAVGIDEARAAGCQAIADEQNRTINADREFVRQRMADDPRATPAEAIRGYAGSLLSEWVEELMHNGWGFTETESVREVMSVNETAESVSEDLRPINGHDHETVFLRSSAGTEYWIEYEDDCGCTRPWGGQCARSYYKKR